MPVGVIGLPLYDGNSPTSEYNSPKLGCWAVQGEQGMDLLCACMLLCSLIIDVM